MFKRIMLPVETALNIVDANKETPEGFVIDYGASYFGNVYTENKYLHAETVFKYKGKVHVIYHMLYLDRYTNPFCISDPPSMTHNTIFEAAKNKGWEALPEFVTCFELEPVEVTTIRYVLVTE